MSRDRETMPSREFRRIRENLNLTRDAFAIELGYEGNDGGNKNTIKRFELGQRYVPLPVAKLAWLLARHGLPEWPRELEANIEAESSHG